MNLCSCDAIQMVKFCPPKLKVKRFCCLLYSTPAPQIRLAEAAPLTSQSLSLHCSTEGELRRPHITDPAQHTNVFFRCTGDQKDYFVMSDFVALTSIEDILVKDESITAVFTAAEVDAKAMDISQRGRARIKHKCAIHSRTAFTETQSLKALLSRCAEFMTCRQRTQGGEYMRTRKNTLFSCWPRNTSASKYF